MQQVEAAVPRGAWASHCSGLSCCEAQAPGTGASVVEAHRPQSAWASVTVARGLTSLQHVEFSRPGIELTSLALAGGYLFTVTPGKFSSLLLKHDVWERPCMS